MSLDPSLSRYASEMDTLAWKQFYAEERHTLGVHGLDALLDAAPVVPLGTALIFPHTRATHSGTLVAAVAASRVGARVPEVVVRYPFLVGTDPHSLPGLEALARLAEGCPVVATTDPIHHGHGYGTAEPRDPADPSTRDWALSAVRTQLDALEQRAWVEFAQATATFRSDFRDTGPVLACLRPQARFHIHALQLVDYADVLRALSPTWVAAALITS